VSVGDYLQTFTNVTS